MGNRYRNEQKYLIQKTETGIIQMRLSGMLEKDPHLGDRASYLIRSIYFDDLDDTCFHEKEDGVGIRRKWRIRAYSCSDSVIHLECKKKVGSMTWKDSVPITRDELEAAVAGSVTIDKDKPPLWNEFALNIITRGYRPVTIVQYERVPFIWYPSNVRITIDKNLSSSNMYDRFFDEDLPTRPIMPQHLDLLEVKYDTLLPDYIRRMINLRDMRCSSFSKYDLCRRLPINPF
ncbi:MAG: polyphosphate polymerase domain-containing protein [Butyrivibrio sp.]|nr:polyphosphate polymerase domain-containing protein [Butyrivibrio sp.]